jgi:hypothetical protein
LFFGEIFGREDDGVFIRTVLDIVEESSAAQNQARRRCVNGLAFSPL